MISKKTATSKRAKLPRSSDYTKSFLKDWERLTHSGRYNMNRLKEVNNGTGFSKGFFGDLFKLAGGRFNPFAEPGTPCSPLGCNQNGEGKIFGIPYSKGSFTDMVSESFAGPHDMANSFHFYDTNGNIQYLGNLSGLQGNLLEYSRYCRHKISAHKAMHRI